MQILSQQNAKQYERIYKNLVCEKKKTVQKTWRCFAFAIVCTYFPIQSMQIP